MIGHQIICLALISMVAEESLLLAEFKVVAKFYINKMENLRKYHAALYEKMYEIINDF